MRYRQQDHALQLVVTELDNRVPARMQQRGAQNRKKDTYCHGQISNDAAPSWRSSQTLASIPPGAEYPPNPSAAKTR